MKLRDGYDRRKNPEFREYRTMTKAEVLGLASGEHVKFLANDGTARDLKIGRVRTWKREPDRVEVSVKYGLREYATFSMEEAMRRLLVREEQE